MNIFLQLSKWANRQGENFATDSLAIVISELARSDPETCAPILDKLTGGLFGLEDLDDPTLQIQTQKSEGIGFGKPDMRLETADKLALVEVKTGAALGESQLHDYRRALKSSSTANTKLILLNQYLTPLGKHSPDYSLLWHELAQAMTDLLKTDSIAATSRYLMVQLVEFLRSKNLALSGVKSKISEGMNRHWVEQGDDSILFKRIKSLDRIASYEELQPLHDILQLMGSALDQLDFDPKPRLDSGQQTGGWIGYNIYRMKHWLCLYYPSPDVIVFESKLWKGERQPSETPLVGEYYYRWESTHWRNMLDLSVDDGRFFEISAEDQFDQMLEFARTSFDIVSSGFSAA